MTTEEILQTISHLYENIDALRENKNFEDYDDEMLGDLKVAGNQLDDIIENIHEIIRGRQKRN